MIKHIFTTPVTWTLVFFNVLCFILIQQLIQTQTHDYIDLFLSATGVTPFYFCQELIGSAKLIYMTYLTSMFVHIESFHIISNLILLFWFGTIVESNIGKLYTILIYIIGGMVSELIYVLTAPVCDSTPVIGASGAISSLIGMFTILFLSSHTRNWVNYCTIGVVIYWLVKQIYSIYQGLGELAYTEHLGGYLFGILFGVLWFKLLPRSTM
jgi:membrane associated rhomboid family serine protease